MKYFFISILVLFIARATHAQYDSIYVDDRWRTFLTHLPPQYDSGQDTLYSVILALHGGYGNAYNMENTTQLSQKADTAANPFIVVYPEGVKSPLGVRTWNAGWCCGYAMDNHIDDVRFISTLIDTLLARYRIDKDRVYATGLSNGGMMSFRLAAELTWKLAAIAPVAASMTLEGPWNPTRAMPIIHFHSYLDEDVPYYGGVGSGSSDHYNPPVDSVLNEWSALNGCANENDTLYHEVGEYLFKVWTQCNNDADIHSYVTYDGGHSWPGGQQGSIFGDPPSEKINANDLMWAFFLEHPANHGTSIVKEKSMVTRNFKLYQNYPNPFNPLTQIRYSISRQSHVKLTVYNLAGRQIQVLVDQKLSAGTYVTSFNGASLANGIYFARMEADGYRSSIKLLLIK
ncbi:T9SS type A sorting domain-containing protein [Calditrichota bacterium LG25]